MAGRDLALPRVAPFLGEERLPASAEQVLWCVRLEEERETLVDTATVPDLGADVIEEHVRRVFAEPLALAPAVDVRIDADAAAPESERETDLRPTVALPALDSPHPPGRV